MEIAMGVALHNLDGLLPSGMLLAQKRERIGKLNMPAREGDEFLALVQAVAVDEPTDRWAVKSIASLGEEAVEEGSGGFWAAEVGAAPLLHQLGEDGRTNFRELHMILEFGKGPHRA